MIETRSSDDSKIIERIRKLLSLGNSPNEAEAKAAIEKAHLMLRNYNLEIADIQDAPEIGKETIEMGGRETKWKNFLLINIAKANYCAFITSKGRGSYAYRLYGRVANIKSASLMYEYLSEVIVRETRVAAGIYVGRISRAEFSQGMALRLGERLTELANEDDEGCKALVPVATEAVKAAFEDCNPRHVREKVSSSFSRDLGYRAAERVSLLKQLGS